MCGTCQRACAPTRKSTVSWGLLLLPLVLLVLLPPPLLPLLLLLLLLPPPPPPLLLLPGRGAANVRLRRWSSPCGRGASRGGGKWCGCQAVGVGHRGVHLPMQLLQCSPCKNLCALPHQQNPTHLRHVLLVPLPLPEVGGRRHPELIRGKRASRRARRHRPSAAQGAVRGTGVLVRHAAAAHATFRPELQPVVGVGDASAINHHILLPHEPAAVGGEPEEQVGVGQPTI